MTEDCQETRDYRDQKEMRVQLGHQVPTVPLAPRVCLVLLVQRALKETWVQLVPEEILGLPDLQDHQDCRHLGFLLCQSEDGGGETTTWWMVPQWKRKRRR